jgi:hypothetical protein
MARPADSAPPIPLGNIAPSPAGPLHLLKMAVGIADIEELRRVRAARTSQHGGSWVYTRNQPRRAEAVLAGGSIYWVIRGQIRVRQRITGLRSERDDPNSGARGRAYCLIEVDPLLVATLWRPWRPFQGWRYLTPADAPPDAPVGAAEALGMPDTPDGALPERMIAELRALGLW